MTKHAPGATDLIEGNVNHTLDRTGVHKRRHTMKKLIVLTITVSCLFLTGCTHAQWAAVETKTELSSWMNPVGFTVHMVASAGAYATKPAPTVRAKTE